MAHRRAGAPRRLWQQRAAWLCAAAALVGVAVAEPAHGSAVLATAQLGGAALVVAVLARRGGLRSRAGGGIATVLALLGASSLLLVVLGAGHPAAHVLITAVQLTGLAIMVPALSRHRQPTGGADGSAMVGLELAIVVVGGAVAVLQTTVASHRTSGDHLLATVNGGVGVTVMCVVVWLALTRAGLPTASKMAMAGGALVTLQHHLAVLAGVPLGAAAEKGQFLGVLAALLMAAAAVHPSLAEVKDPARPLVLRSGSARLAVVIPFGAVPFFAWAVGMLHPPSALPAWLLLGTAALSTALALVRALALVAESERQADTDPLTGGLGRRGGLRRLDAMFAARRPAWVCVFDLDDFTDVNERHGQESGDALLRLLVGRLERGLPRTTVVARTGSDEVLVLVPEEAAATAQEVAHTALAVCDEPFAVGGVPVPVTASMGISALGAADTARAALGCADIALRAAKARGGDGWLAYDEQMRDDVLGRLQLLRDLRELVAGSGRAHAADGAGHLVVQYQPLVHLATGVPVSVEALVRWEHPVRGLLSPAVFLPLAESAGVGAALDRAVMRQALHQLAAWDALGLGVSRAGVNLGRDSMREPGLRESVLAACAEAGVTPDRLALEITEHDELDSDAGVVADLLALREAGTSVALDDFGAGHASVGYLRRWPADVVKLDRSLLPGVAPAQPHAAMLDPLTLITAVGALVTALDRWLVVEGVEDPADVAVARGLGAEYAQGFHFAPPMGPEALIAWWRERAAVIPAQRDASPLGAAGSLSAASEPHRRLP